MRYIGIDYGTKRIGVAVSDDEGTLAFPREVLRNSPETIERLVDLCQGEGVAAIVVGDSIDLNGRPNPLMDVVRPFASALSERLSLPLYYMNEVLTSREAMHIQGDNDHNDASAAAIMLQSFLDRERQRP